MRSLSGAMTGKGFGAFGLDALSRVIKRKTSRRQPLPARNANGTGKLPRKALRAEKPGWRERWRRGEAPNRSALAATVAFLCACLAYGAVLGGKIGMAAAGARDLAIAATRTAGFGLTELRITGAERLTPPEIAKRIGIDGTTSLLAYDAQAGRKALLDIPWIKSASIRVLLPGTLEVSIVERQPYALWQFGGKVVLIDRDGLTIGPYDDARFSTLPLLVGEGADGRAAEAEALLDQHPAIRSRVRAAVLVAARRWTLKLGDGVDIMLPEKDPARAVAALERLDRETGLLNRDIAAVDMRLNDRIVVRLTDRGAQLRNEALKARSRLPAAQTSAPNPPRATPPRPPGRVI